MKPNRRFFRIVKIRNEFRMSPNRYAPSVLGGRTSLCVPSRFARRVINRRRICDVLKLVHREQPASPVVPAFRYTLLNRARHLLPPKATEELTELRIVHPNIDISSIYSGSRKYLNTQRNFLRI